MADTAEDKMAPVQGYTPGIPWSLHLEAYDVYRKKYGAQQALIEGWCRGGFGTGELDEFIPGWRDKVSEIGKLKAEVQRQKALHHDCAGQLRLALSERDALAVELAALKNPVNPDEQAAFQDWLERTAPSGDVTEVQLQWEASSDYLELYEQTLTCDDCGVPTADPWHSSVGTNRHYHRCDACHEQSRKPEAWKFTHTHSSGKISVYLVPHTEKNRYTEIVDENIKLEPLFK